MFTALIATDNRTANAAYSAFLAKGGYDVVPTFTPEESIRAFDTMKVDIVLCDIAFDGIENYTLIQFVRKSNPDTPIIVLTGLSDFGYKQHAFEAGCDDFMSEPVDLNELELRLGALLRRAHAVSKRRLVIGNAVLDSDSLTVVEGARSTELPPKEFLILFKLCSSAGRIFTRQSIMDDVWGSETNSNERTVDVHVKRLREHFKESESFRIDTIRGVGYKVTALK